MTVSTDAILFYGYCWDEECEDFFDPSEGGDDMEWPERILINRGERNPWDEHPADDPRKTHEQNREASVVWTKTNRAKLDAWAKQKDAVEAEFGVELDHHCSAECQIPYVSAAKITAWRGFPAPIYSLAIDPQWAGRLDRFLAAFGIAKPHPEPRWWLVSYWG